MNELTIFQFQEGREVRTLEKDGNLWFAAMDAENILEIQNVRQNISGFPENEKGVYSIYTLGGNQEMLFINEPGLYRLIFQSRKPEAEAFKTWVFNEVLPSIRKTGSYSMLKRDHENLQNVYHQMENYRMKYINLLDKLESNGMKTREIWDLSKVDQDFLTEYSKKMISGKKTFQEVEEQDKND